MRRRRVDNRVRRFRSGASSGSFPAVERKPPERHMGFMETRKKMPAEAVELYSQFIHGHIGRRDFMNGLKRYANGGLTVTPVVEVVVPNYALGQQVRKDDERIKVSYETVPSPNGNGYIRGYFAR